MPDHRLDLPNGAWADIIDPQKVTRGRRKPVRAALMVMNRYKGELEEWAAAVAAQEASAANPGILGPVPTFAPVPEVGVSDPAADTAAEVASLEKYDWSESELEMVDAMQEALTVALVSAWSYPVPVSIASLNEIPATEADDLIIHCSQFVGELFVSTEPSPDEASPTTP